MKVKQVQEVARVGACVLEDEGSLLGEVTLKRGDPKGSEDTEAVGFLGNSPWVILEQEGDPMLLSDSGNGGRGEVGHRGEDWG